MTEQPAQDKGGDMPPPLSPDNDLPGEANDVVIDDVELTDVESEVVAAERDAYRETLQHLQADFENYRKRMVKQQTEMSERANETLVQKLLPVLDTIGLAQAHEPSGSLDQVSTALLEVLKKEGLEKMETVNQPFDPTLHEAVAHEDGEGGPVVTEEMRSGYKWKGRVLRPAMVKVVG